MNKCYLNCTLNDLKQELIDLEEEGFVEKYRKIDAFIGDLELIKFIEKILKKNLDN